VKKRVVIAGLGDTGLLAALHLYPAFDVVGVTPKPCLVSGQELGTRLARPNAWREHFLMSFSRYRRLDGMPVLQGLITRVDTEKRQIAVRTTAGEERELEYDALVIASGVTNGFWRNASVEDSATIDRRIDADAERFARASRIAVLGGGGTGVSAASNLKEAYPTKEVHLFYSQTQVLPSYHPNVRGEVEARLRRQGVVLHPGHRAVLPAGFLGEQLTTGAIEWTTGQPAFHADVTLWAIGPQHPNTGFLPPAMLDASGYVKVDPRLRVPGAASVFAVGDVAATDPNRCSARNGGALTVAHNVRCLLSGREARMKVFEPPRHRWGSILGMQREGMRVFTARGGNVLMPSWFVDRVLFPWVVRRGIYKGVRD
jgi:apoptosis-inducing factor 2